ncbi:glycosyltransferase family 2 protein [Bosea sp. BK604]|uniref:glycosyltransferase family 2 protein n=1 Tax=Bosea sp. BK604 TaxID=2512180 RepID=UPI001048CFB4|nr:glycosyltransferase family 2 protein [Bosea sp. BK604]TCR69997.1 dolichol-phosphate mannosyltransferase [Bosea sp. BK604]
MISSGSARDLSVVIPIYGCAGAIFELYERLTRALVGMQVDYEIIFIDDVSPDGSWDLLLEAVAGDSRVTLLRLARNHGQHIAITAGLAESCGEKVIVMDGDLQDQPEAIPLIYEKASATEAPVVYAKRKADHQKGSRVLFGKLYFRLLEWIAGRKIDPEYGTFTLITRPVVEAYLSLKESNRHYLFILYWLGFAHAEIEFARDKRSHGRSSYNFMRLLSHAFQGMKFYAASLQRLLLLATGLAGLAGVALLLIALLGFDFAADGVVRRAVLALGSLIAIGCSSALALVGVLAFQAFEEAKDRPLYIVHKRIRGGEINRAITSRASAGVHMARTQP